MEYTLTAVSNIFNMEADTYARIVNKYVNFLRTTLMDRGKDAILKCS